MQYITRYQKDNDLFRRCYYGVELEQSHIDLLENGYPLKAEVEPTIKNYRTTQKKYSQCVEI